MNVSEGNMKDLYEPLLIGTLKKVILSSYFVILIITSLIGNGFIVAGSFRNCFIKTDKVTMVFLETLAGLDILIAIFYVLPAVVTVISGRWLLGQALCFTNAFVSRALYFNEVFLTVTISCYRLWMLDKPGAVRRQLKIIYLRILLASELVVSFGITGLMLISRKVKFNPKFLSCTLTAIPNASSPGTIAIGGFFFVGIPIVIIIVTNSLIVIKAIGKRQIFQRNTMQTSCKGDRKMKLLKGSNAKTFLIISLVCWVFISCYLPVFILSCFIAVNHKPPVWFSLFSVTILSLTIAANPLVYGATNQSFRANCGRTAARIISLLRNSKD